MLLLKADESLSFYSEIRVCILSSVSLSFCAIEAQMFVILKLVFVSASSILLVTKTFKPLSTVVILAP
jgi:hypothetical protein